MRRFDHYQKTPTQLTISITNQFLTPSVDIKKKTTAKYFSCIHPTWVPKVAWLRSHNTISVIGGSCRLMAVIHLSHEKDQVDSWQRSTYFTARVEFKGRVVSRLWSSRQTTVRTRCCKVTRQLWPNLPFIIPLKKMIRAAALINPCDSGTQSPAGAHQIICFCSRPQLQCRPCKPQMTFSRWR